LRIDGLVFSRDAKVDGCFHTREYANARESSTCSVQQKRSFYGNGRRPSDYQCSAAFFWHPLFLNAFLHAFVTYLSHPGSMNNQLSRETIDTLRTFAIPALAIGILCKTQLDLAISTLELAVSESCKDRLISFREAAEAMGVSKRTISRMIQSGELQGRCLRSNCPQSMRVFQSSIDKLLQAGN